MRVTPWPVERVDAVFSANTLHIISWSAVEDFFRGVGTVLHPAGVLCVYGPFNYGGRYTSESNRHFDLWLKSRDPHSGIRDFEALDGPGTRRGPHLQRRSRHACQQPHPGVAGAGGRIVK